jgi:hypothetical protein
MENLKATIKAIIRFTTNAVPETKPFQFLKSEISYLSPNPIPVKGKILFPDSVVTRF